MNIVREGAEWPVDFDPLLRTAIEPLCEAPAPALRDPDVALGYDEYFASEARAQRPQLVLLQGGLSVPVIGGSTQLLGLRSRDEPTPAPVQARCLVDATELTRKDIEAIFPGALWKPKVNKVRRLGDIGVVAEVALASVRRFFGQRNQK